MANRNWIRNIIGTIQANYLDINKRTGRVLYRNIESFGFEQV